MAEPKEPKRPLLGSPDAPLPRLWKAEPDEEPEPETPTKKGKKAKHEPVPEPVKATKKAKKGDRDKKAKDSKKAKEGKEGEPKGVLKEETPTFDTYDTRQRVRIITGSLLTGLFLLFGFIIFRWVSPRAEPNQPDMQAGQDLNPGHSIATVPSPSPAQRANDEDAARLLYNRAREVASNKNTGLAVSILQSVVSKYPKSQAAGDARAALDRPNQNPPLPLFLDRTTVVARTPDRPAPLPDPPKTPEIVVEASRTTVTSASNGQASLALPANPAEMAPVARPSAGQVAPSKTLPKGYRMRPGSDVHESGWPMEIVGDRDGAPMVFVPGGTFLQGRDGGESSEGPEHRVNLGSFYIDRHEVTVRQFNLFQKEDGKRTERDRALAKDPAHAKVDEVEDNPVVMVSARDAKDFADWAGKFLPTEAQWEAAARTPDGRIYPWGPQPPAWSKPRAPRQIDPIMSFPSDVSPYGVFDLAGNAWEWTKDWYDAHYYNHFRNSTAENPTGPEKPRSAQLVVKGSGRDWTASKREGLRFDVRYPYLGFRCVIQVEGPGNVFEPPPPPPAPGQPAAPRGGNSVVVPF